ncbi:hypothetical protein M514_28152 [Trichuris suis]|uniref:Uncharacterized protein n=1 Tax=Trichuris suis TaxID=68888 RepID=A0A085MR25_9BILA|nr:hypothetical protein M514_28152 [Trichuris suis]
MSFMLADGAAVNKWQHGFKWRPVDRERRPPVYRQPCNNSDAGLPSTLQQLGRHVSSPVDRQDSDLEAFSDYLSDASFAPLAFQPSA